MIIPIILIFIFGLAVGSFLNVVVWRLPRGKRLTGRSQCPNCKHKLEARNLIPLVSFLVLRGRCQWCKVKISIRYPILELVTAALFALLAYYFYPTTISEILFLLRNLVILSGLISIFVIDLEHFLILDVIVFPLSVFVFIFNLTIDLLNFQQLFSIHSLTLGGLLAAAFLGMFFLLLHILSKGKWMGLGYVKFAILLGLAIGWPQILVVAFLSFTLGTIISLPLLFFGAKMTTKLPFGAFLSLSALITLLYGGKIAAWYLGLIGWY
jgi:leader peptidase (prepilin peptidase)/N-methyltransferase